MKKDYSNILGAVIGDIAGSRFEWHPHKDKDFELLFKADVDNELLTVGFKSCHFTDDTVMTLAIAEALMESKKDFSDLKENTIRCMKEFGEMYPHSGYGRHFKAWLMSPSSEPYNSFGNGSAMRVSPVAYYAKDIEEVKTLSRIVTEVTHNHEEGIKGAEATAVCIFMALHGFSKEEIRQEAEKYYNLDFDYQELLDNYRFDVTCQGSVPQSLFAFFISNSYEDTIRTAISMGGDSDTMAAIAGSIASAYYGIPDNIKSKTKKEFLPQDLLDVVEKFEKCNLN